MPTRWAPSKCDVAGCATMIDTGEPATSGVTMSVNVRLCQKDVRALDSGEATLVVALAPSALTRAGGCHCVRRHGGELDAKDCPIHGAERPA